MYVCECWGLRCLSPCPDSTENPVDFGHSSQIIRFQDNQQGGGKTRSPFKPQLGMRSTLAEIRNKNVCGLAVVLCKVQYEVLKNPNSF